MNGLWLLVIIVAAVLGGVWAYMVLRILEYRAERERRRQAEDAANRYAEAMIRRDQARGWATDGSGHHGDLTTAGTPMRPGT